MCPGDHWKKLPNGGRERMEDSPLAKIIARPNSYQSISDFLLNAIRDLYQTGNFYALALRDERFEIAELHLMKSSLCAATVAETGEIFYQLGGNSVIERRFGALSLVPAREVLHVRLHGGYDMLRGETPLVAAALDVAANNAALSQQIAFLANQAKPSIMLSTDSVLTRDQTIELRERWNEQTRGEGAGGTPILTAGLKPITVSTSAVDAQVAEMMKMGDQHIALAFRLPLQVLGIGGTPYASTELLMQSWIATGLGFALNHIEEAIGNFFGLKGFPTEYVEFNTKALERSAFKDRIEALSQATISGIYAPDEARNSVDLGTVPGGHGKMPRVQQQVVPLDWEPPVAAAPAPVAPDTPNEPDASKAIAAVRLKTLEAVHAL
jgi:HK97 family phage portal protein